MPRDDWSNTDDGYKRRKQDIQSIEDKALQLVQDNFTAADLNRNFTIGSLSDLHFQAQNGELLSKETLPAGRKSEDTLALLRNEGIAVSPVLVTVKNRRRVHLKYENPEAVLQYITDQKPLVEKTNAFIMRYTSDADPMRQVLHRILGRVLQASYDGLVKSLDKAMSDIKESGPSRPR